MVLSVGMLRDFSIHSANRKRMIVVRMKGLFCIVFGDQSYSQLMIQRKFYACIVYIFPK